MARLLRETSLGEIKKSGLPQARNSESLAMVRVCAVVLISEGASLYLTLYNVYIII